MDLVQYINRLYANIIKQQSDEQVSKIIYYNIARLLALYKSYWAAMNKIFIYARPCVNKMTCSAVFFVPFPKYPKIDGNDKKLSRLFLEFSFVLATQSNSKSGDMFRK